MKTKKIKMRDGRTRYINELDYLDSCIIENCDEYEEIPDEDDIIVYY